MENFQLTFLMVASLFKLDIPSLV